MQAVQLSRTHRILVGVVVTGAVVIAAIGFAGSYAAVRALAAAKGFGAFAPFFPIGIDAGIVVLLALDLLLTWIRIPFPLLRQTAWLLTAATIAFNGAAAWPDPLGVGMHAVIPVLFVVSVEAARHAIGRIADITADRHMEGVRVARWLLAFPSTFRLWRRMKLWELRSYDQVIRMEQDRLVYEARLRARFGRAWRRKAPVEALMPLRLARYGVPLAETGPAGLASAGIAEPLRPPAGRRALPGSATAPGGPTAEGGATAPQSGTQAAAAPQPGAPQAQEPGAAEGGYGAPQSGAYAANSAAGAGYAANGWAGPQADAPQAQGPSAPDGAYAAAQGVYGAPRSGAYAGTGSAAPQAQGAGAADGGYGARPQAADAGHAAAEGAYGAPQAGAGDGGYAAAGAVGPQAQAANGGRGDAAGAGGQEALFEDGAAAEPSGVTVPVSPGRRRSLGDPGGEPGGGEPQDEGAGDPVGIPDDIPREEVYFQAYRQFAATEGGFPTARQLSRALHEGLGVTQADGSLLSEQYLRGYLREFRERYRTEMGLVG